MSSTPPARSPGTSAPSVWQTLLTSWTRADRMRVAGVLAVVVLMHLLAFGVLFGVLVPAHYHVGTRAFGVGLGLTAYTYGLRHAFDADHIAAIDNTTRKLRGEGTRSTSVGFWFSLGHSTIVAVLAALAAAGSQMVTALTRDGNAAPRILGLVGTTVSGGFLYLIAALNLVALVGILRVWQAMRRGEYDESRLEEHLDSRGVVARILRRLNRTISHPGQMYLVGMLFGLGFDTATEVVLLVIAGSGAASGLPWYAIMVLPLLFAAGMSLLDTLDGLFMSVAYDWAFLDPVRKVYYNLSITGLSIAVALVIGTIDFVGVLHDDVGWVNPFSTWISGIGLNNVGFVVVGLFVLVWVVAVAYWRATRVGDRWVVEEEVRR
ncbi:HoxN/HupN/NixA family nickel/cobalt transporter [Raineyella fluvialis]|uniref:Nickel/cobalt efflux system n=1 Tax=Raineyella fluvialis TaxID=2662261 RepID=A0A5Q2FBF2_9ACTN|nr:HoxN/HupN/NixA family nickel/cobalt transporter [Raineyella fluvialis]QGF24370.1 HoxN/HupN/NixA family nickel/cobalt transporter [Raineyella fluvialis]